MDHAGKILKHKSEITGEREQGRSVTENTIDISTELGAAKLKNLTVKQAEDLAKREAIMKYKCGTLVNPQYTYLKKGKRILRITVYGFPAMYKNQEK